MRDRDRLRRLLTSGLSSRAAGGRPGSPGPGESDGGIVPWWAKHYPRVLWTYWRSGEDGLSEIEEELRTRAARQREGKFSKRDVAYTPFVPLPPLEYRHECGHCRFWVDSAPGKPGECMIVGRKDDPWGGTAIHEKAGCALFTPPAGESPFDWVDEQRRPTGADLVRGEYHEPRRQGGVDIPIEGGDGPTREPERKRARCHATRKAVGESSIPAGPTVDVERVADGFAAPIGMAFDPADPDRAFVADQNGLVHRLDAGGLADDPFLDLREAVVDLETQYDERGLLGLALHPEFDQNGRLFVRYSAPNREGTPEDYDHTEVLAEFTANDGRTAADPESERTILEIPSPQFNHNAGGIEFGPDDGYLYIALGDGGGEGDRDVGHAAGGNGQDVTENLLGGILRIDVDGEGSADGESRPYAVPDDNPLVGEAGRDEFYAWGLRNPWGISFDSEGRLFVADVGQALYEEVNLVEKGGNYGWNVKEGTHCFNPENPWDPPTDCPDENDRGERFVDPIVEYPHVEGGEVVGSAVVGGHYYEGEAMPKLSDAYVFGDWATTQDQPSGRLFAARPPDGGSPGAGDDGTTGGERWSMEELEVGSSENGRLNRMVLAFERGPDGELYVLSNETHVPKGETGAVHRIVPDE